MSKDRGTSAGDIIKYILLFIAVMLLAILVYLTYRVYQNYERNSADNIQILNEADTETADTGIVVKNETETVNETEAATETETVTEKATEKATEKVTEKTTEKITEEETAAAPAQKKEDIAKENTAKLETAVQSTTLKQPENKPVQTVPQSGASAQDTKPAQTTPQTEASVPQTELKLPELPPAPVVETELPQPVYRTIVSTCNLRSYPDYGDNVIGECYAGDTVEFFGEEAGWYKISLNGTVGYIGKRFLN